MSAIPRPRPGALSLGALGQTGAIPRHPLGGVRLRPLRTLYGRRNIAIPGGVVLPEAFGGTPPYTYSVEDLPAGTVFTPATRALSGAPTAAGDNVVTYKVEDSSMPVGMASRTFEWPVLDLLSTHAIMLQDFDSGRVGYHVSDFEFAYASTIISGEDPSISAQETLWSTPPRNPVGSVVDDPFEKRTISTGAILSSIQWRSNRNPDQIRFFDSDQDLAGNPVDSDVGAWANANPGLSWYLQRALAAPGVVLGFDDINHSATWNVTWNVTSTQAAWIRANLAEDDQFLFVIA